MSKIAIYCRVSTQMQHTDRQREELLARAKAKGVEISENHIYIDYISGFSKAEERPQYNELLEAINRHEIDEIWFSELTRLGRSSVELQSEVEKLQNQGVTLFFQKQDIIVTPNKKDLGSRIVLTVLAVCASYEIELFAERSISGKITKIKNGGGVGGDNASFGYMNNSNKKMVIREDEAKVVKWIFEQYANGKTTLDIADTLNAQGTPTALTTRVPEAATRRESKGLPPKENSNFTKSTQQWRPNMVSKLLSKELYTGHRHVVFHKPNVDKANNEQEQEAQEREIIYEYDEYVEDLRIVSDELFQQVQERLLTAHYNKNNAVKHENLLKAKLKCGECGSNFSVGKSTENATGYLSGGRSYKCYGRVNRRDKPQICTDGAEVKQWRLDGLVLSMSLRMFADIDLKTTSANQISELTKRNEELTKIINSKKATLEKSKEEYKQLLRRLSKIAIDDIEASELIDEAQSDFKKKESTLNRDIDKHTKEKVANLVTINNMKTISQNSSRYQRMDEIWKSKDIVKTMVDEFIQGIVLYRPNPRWVLVVVTYKNNVEMWGTLKSKKYKRSEMFYDENFCNHGIEFHTWIINNTDHHFIYNPINKTFTYDGLSDIYNNIDAGTYTFEQLHQILYEKDWIGSYPFYCYENNEYNINPPERNSKIPIMPSRWIHTHSSASE